MLSVRKIAEMAGVSIATVSRYMNNEGYVSEKTRQKIKEVISKNRYIPNRHASALFTKKSNIIGLIVSDISNPFFTQIIRSIEKSAYENNYFIFLCDTYGKKDVEKEYINKILGYRVDGIIVARGLCTKEYEDIGIPIISIDGKISDNIINIVSDNYEGGRQAAEILYECGCNKILHIRGPKKFESANERYRGFKDKLNELKIKFDVLETKYNIVDIKHINTNVFLKNYDGIFVWNDVNANLIYSMCLEKGIRVPEDINIIGFDDIQMEGYISPKLTTIRQQTSVIGEMAVEVLFNLMNNKNEVLHKNKVVIETKKIIRNSTRREEK